MNTGDMEKLAETVAEKTVAKTFKSLGLDIDDPIEVQSQFAFLRNCYYGARHVRNVVIASIGGLVASGICWAVWASIKAPAAGAAVSHTLLR